MPAATAAYSLDLKRRGALEPAEVPGRAVAWLALYGPTAWTGRFLDYDDPEIVAPARCGVRCEPEESRLNR